MSNEAYFAATHISSFTLQIISLSLFYSTFVKNSLLKARMRKQIKSSASVFKQLHIFIHKINVILYDTSVSQKLSAM
jgi:hypothetical protein